MPFPTSGILVDFTTQPDGGPPPTADFDTGFFFESMVVEGGVCKIDPEAISGQCDAPYIASEFTLPLEVWGILGPLDTDRAAVYIADFSSTWFFQWQYSGDNYFFLRDGEFNSLWSSMNEFDPLVEGGGLGMRANSDGSLELWVTYDGSSWAKIHTETGLTISGEIVIGLASFAVG